MSGTPTELLRRPEIDFTPSLGQVSPKLVQEIEEDGEIDIRREFNPLVVTRLGGTLAFETETTQLQCGETITDNNGDQNIRLVMGCVATHSQFKELQRMRSSPDTIKLVSRAYTGPATFDEMKFDRVPDSNGSIDAEGGESNEPHYTIQLQSKESST